MKKRITQKSRLFTILYQPVPEGGFIVRVPLLPDIITYGRTLEEARKMAEDAINCSLEALKLDHKPLPYENSFLQEHLAVRF